MVCNTRQFQTPDMRCMLCCNMNSSCDTACRCTTWQEACYQLHYCHNNTPMINRIHSTEVGFIVVFAS
jgi:hypothetical protein